MPERHLALYQTQIAMQNPDPNTPRELTYAELLAFNSVAQVINIWAESKGFNDHDLPDLERSLVQIGLMHTELSEMFEGLRCGNPPDDKTPQLSSEEAELADLFIRGLHYAAEHNIDIAAAIMVKHNYNLTRPHKHGKAC